MPNFEPRNSDFDTRVRESFNRQKVMRTMGITIAELRARAYRSGDGA